MSTAQPRPAQPTRAGLRIPVLLLGAGMLLTVVSCGRPTPQKPTATEPASGTRKPERTGEQRRELEIKASELQKSVAAAAELFNIGENDLACDQVEQASALMPAAASASPATVVEELQRFQQACGPG